MRLFCHGLSWWNSLILHRFHADLNVSKGIILPESYCVLECSVLMDAYRFTKDAFSEDKMDNL